jgi:L-asparaginase
MERYELSDKDLAIICASHQGTIEQARQAFNVLWRCEIDPSALKCPCPEGQQSALQHNCSGKHVGMLAVCQQRNWSLNGYTERNHPVQKMILDRIADLLKMPAAEFIGVHDDCGAPTYLLQLRQIACLYGQLASGNHLGMERIVRAMTHYPELISGEGGFDTELMRLTDGELVSKAGSEGIQCVSRIGQGLGLAIKVMDGSKRAKYAVAIHLLKQLGWITPTISEALEEQFMLIGDYKRLDIVGELTMV